MVAIQESNEVYNNNFLLVQETTPNFPDGWSKTGGDEATIWEWTGPPTGPRAIVIHHPTGPRSGIIQSPDVTIQATENQRWELTVSLETDPAGISCYVRVYMGSSGAAQQVFSLIPSSSPEDFNRIFTTPSGTRGLRMEIGIFGPGTLVIHNVKAYRLYPKRTIRLDEKGQLFVNKVDSIGQIQSPVYVKLISPSPVPVSFQSPITNDIRNITPTRDGIRIYGSDGRPLATTPDGMLKVVQASSNNYQESTEYVTANVNSAATSTKDISTLRVFSYAVYNRGTVSAFVVLGISPDGNIWFNDGHEKEVTASSLKPFTASYFLRYVKLIYRTNSGATPITIWWQAQE